MNKDIKKKYGLIAKISEVVIGLVLVLGISYAVFRTTTMADKDNVVNAGKLDVRVENEKDEITIPNALPQTEEQGKSSTPYTFDIVNEGTIDAMYDLYIELSDDTTLKDNDIRYYLTKTVDGTETPIDDKASHYLSDAIDETKKEKKLYRIDINDELKTKDKVSYKLYLWIDYDATSEDATNKVFKGVIRIDASQLVERNETLLRKVDVSENSDGSAYAYVYEDGTLKIKGTGNITSGIDDMDIYATNPTKQSKAQLKAYKGTLAMMGYDVSTISSMDEYQTWLESQSEEVQTNINDNIDNYFSAYLIKQTLEEMGYENTDTIVDVNTAMAYLQNNGLMIDERDFTTDGEVFLSKFESAYNEIVEGTVSITNVEISEGITNIPEGLYTGNGILTTVTIPSTVTNIAERAFYECTRLKTINIPSSITSIGSYAFDGCTGLTSIDIPKGVTSIGNSAFRYCSSLTTINVDENNETYFSTDGILGTKNNMELIKCPEGKTTATIDSTVISIGSLTFENCTLLTLITIPNSVASIGDYAFYRCTSLTSIDIPNSVKSIDTNAFSYCNSLTAINVDENNETYFSTDGMLGTKSNMELTLCPTAKTSAIISDSVKSIGDSAFYGCTSLTSIDIPSSVTNIGKGAFQLCRGLTKITIPSSVTSIGNSAFQNCSGLTSIDIPKGVTSIGSSAFQNCSGLTSIEIPNSVTSIGDSAFSGCNSLTSITIPSSITSIENAMFLNCTGLTSITIPTSVTSIGNQAFANCPSLKTITIPNSVITIGSAAFSMWTSSQTINIDNTVGYVNNHNSSSWNSGCKATINYLRT